MNIADRIDVVEIGCDECLAVTRAALGVPAYKPAWAEGRAMTLAQAIGYALAGQTK